MGNWNELERMARESDEMARQMHQQNHFGGSWSRARFEMEKKLENQAQKLREEANRQRRAHTRWLWGG